jgi:tetratricopeptide (TPR) repeat protein
MALNFRQVLVCGLALSMAACATGNKHVNKGFVAFADKDYVKAEAEFSEAMKDNPKDLFAQLNLAAVYQNTGRPELAVPLYLNVVERGKNVRPNRKANSQERTQTLAEMAQSNLTLIMTAGSSVTNPGSNVTDPGSIATNPDSIATK